MERASGQAYVWEDRSAPSGGTYWVEAIDVQGRSDWTGPVVTRPGAAFRASPAATLLSGTAHSYSSSLTSLNASTPVQQVGPLAGSNRALQWRLAGLAAAKLQVPGQGYYHVPAEQLFAAGILKGTAVSSLSLWAGAQPVAFSVLSADGISLQPGDAIEFYGLGLDTYYTGTQVYWLTNALGDGRRMSAASVQPFSTAGNSFSETVELPQHSNFTYEPGIAQANRFFGWC